MTIKELIKILNDMILIYGDKTILSVTDGISVYSIKQITGKQCAKYFRPIDHVSEVIITIKKED